MSSTAILTQPFEARAPWRAYRWHSAHQASGLMLSSPHSGRAYPPAFLAQTRLSTKMIRSSEDAFVDELLINAPAAGGHVLSALYPRAYVDLNRPPNELDPAMFDAPLPPDIVTDSPRLRAGLGMIARRVSEQAEIYSAPLQYGDITRRLRRIYYPFHRILTRKLAQLREQFGQALLLDMHSMPSISKGNTTHPVLQDNAPRNAQKRRQPDFVLGTRFGRSCHKHIADSITQYLTQLGYQVAHNQPYAGGYITEHYGAPALGTHVVQIEINRSLYMDETTLAPHTGFAPLRDHLTGLVTSLAKNWMSRLPPLATDGLNAAE